MCQKSCRASFAQPTPITRRVFLEGQMIENDHQLEVTTMQLIKLETALKLLTEADNSDVHPLLLKAQIEGLHSVCAELAGEMLDYLAKIAAEREGK